MHNTAYFEGYDGIVGADFSMQMDPEIAMAEKKLRFYQSADCEQTWLGYWDQDAIVVPYSNEGWSDKRPRDGGTERQEDGGHHRHRGRAHHGVPKQHVPASSAIPTRETAAPLNSNWADETVKNARLQTLIIQNGGSKANEADMVLGVIGRAGTAVAVAAPAQGLFLLFGRRLVQRR
jgi:hypothetical protein